MSESTVTPSNSSSCAEAQFFSPRQRIAFFVLIAVGLVLRWAALDLRPFHHDESLHGMYGKYFFDFPDVNYYKYQALLHGPFLYNLYRIVYNTLGQGDWAARVPINFVGSLLIFAPIVFRRYFSARAVLTLTAAVALSPTLIYWSRFLREDTLIIACMVIMLYGATLAGASRKALVFGVALCIQFCIKENAYVTVAILLGFCIYEFLLDTLFLGTKNSVFSNLAKYVRAYGFATLNALAIAVFIYCYLYSAGFRYWKGVLDGLYRESLVYWYNQHKIDRITGPYLFHFYMLSWYELAFVLAWGAQIWTFYRRRSLALRCLGAGILLAAFVTSITFSGRPFNQYPILGVLKLKDAYDVFGFILFVPQALIVTTVYLIEKNRKLAFFGYLFWANLCTYSYLGEKVPWLSSYPFIAGLVFLTLYFDEYFRDHAIENWQSYPVEKILRIVGITMVLLGGAFVLEEGDYNDLMWVWFGLAFVGAGLSLRAAGVIGRTNVARALFAVFCVYTLRAAVLTNFVYAGEAREYISQVHTTAEIHGIANKIKEEIALKTNGYKPTVLVTGESTWPMTWYFRDIPEYRFQASPGEFANFDYIIQNWTDNEPATPANFRTQRINLRGWWVPDYRQMTLKKFLGYALNHTPWSSTGYSYAWFLVNPNSRELHSGGQK